MNTTFTEEKYKIADLIDAIYLTNYDSWLSILWAMKSEGFTEEQAKQISKKAPNYTEEGLMNAWNKPKQEITITQGTLNHYAKLINREEYYKIQEESNQVVMNKKYFNSIKSKNEMTEELKNKVADYDNKNKTCQKQIDKELKQFKTECKKSSILKNHILKNSILKLCHHHRSLVLPMMKSQYGKKGKC